jgi:hypothetical protein
VRTLDWTTIARGRKADRGHTLVAVAETVDDYGFRRRTYARCQCGKVYSGWGHDGGYYGHSRHVRNELAKLDEGGES